MGAPSDQFLHLLWRPPYVFFFHTIWGPSDHFFAYYIGAPRSLSSLTIWGPSDHFLLIQYGGPPQILFFFTKYMGASSDQFLRLLYEAPSGMGVRRIFSRGGGKPLGGAPKICEGGPPYFFRQTLKYAYRRGGGSFDARRVFF